MRLLKLVYGHTGNAGKRAILFRFGLDQRCICAVQHKVSGTTYRRGKLLWVKIDKR
mgnify:CR=1 FL=1